MKKHLLFIFLLFFTINLSANSKLLSITDCSEFDEILISDNQIKVAGKFVGKFEVKTKDLEVNSKEKIMIYEVSIFKENGEMIANLDLKVIDKIKKRSINVVDASLKTVRDNVKHNSSNFISFQEMDSNKNLNLNVPQFHNVVKYLLSYNYF